MLSYILMVSIRFMRFSNERMVQWHNFSVYFQHVIKCFHLHYDVLSLANVNINTLLAYFDGIWKVSFFSENACSDAFRFVLHCIYTNDTNSAALSDVNCLFSVVVYLGIQVDAIFDSITNMIGRFFICKLSSRRHVTMQACKRLDGEERAGCFA